MNKRKAPIKMIAGFIYCVLLVASSLGAFTYLIVFHYLGASPSKSIFAIVIPPLMVEVALLAVALSQILFLSVSHFSRKKINFYLVMQLLVIEMLPLGREFPGISFLLGSWTLLLSSIFTVLAFDNWHRHPFRNKFNSQLHMLPHVTSPWVGVRAWSVQTSLWSVNNQVESLYSLGSINKRGLPFVGVIHQGYCSTCAQVPTLTHACGLYALYNLDAIERYGGNKEPTLKSVIGGVMAMGRTVEHPGQGFRSERQKILAILDRSRKFEPDVLSQLVAKSLKIPCLKESEFMAYLSHRGEMASIHSK